ncbi:unnamed protein product [Bursaphelenchus okinawaensis]|uniref:Major facilitator superfamily (MFS) profile domain-containing protein n=1 Tax=Bursaphelenchus okinawaensis TaxID=465554 RepID=A0A811KP34_9BILA|nr:unnamed protein product [Bursaphelenchus okinawaensis]CAG9106703.1 unnamed protein product [Bursaphelenchus okinawaensis]
MTRIYVGADIPARIIAPDAPKSEDFRTYVSSEASTDKVEPGCKFFKVFNTRTRFLIMVNVLLCLASVWSNILAFNFALVCFNDAPEGEEDEAVFTPNQRSFLTSIVAATAFVANFIVVQLVNRFGIRTLFTILGLLSAASTALLPLAISNGYYYTLVLRGLQGIAFSANFPVIGAFTSKWTYYKQNGLVVSSLVAYVQLSPALTMPISGALCESSMKWPSVFYAHAIVSAILFVLFGVFYRNSPEKHPFVGDTELNKVKKFKSNQTKKELRAIPYLQILKTPAVWAVWIGGIGNFVCVNMMFLYSPTYMSKVLGFPVHSTGISSALAPLAQFLIKLTAGVTSDKIRCLNETNKLRLYNSVAFFGGALLLSVLAFWPSDQHNFMLLLFGASAGLLGFTTGGFFKAGPLVSKQYSHFVTGNISQTITLTMLIVPFLVNGLAPDNTADQWTWVFVVTAVVLAVTNLLFLIMVSAQPASWTQSLSNESSVNSSTTTQA